MSAATQPRPLIPTGWSTGAKAALGLSLLLILELLAATTWLDGASLIGQNGLAGYIGASGAWVLRFGVGFAAAFAAFAGLEGRLTLVSFLDTTGLRWPWLGCHVLSAAAFGTLSAGLYGGSANSDLAAAAWILSGVAVPATLALSYAPLAFWKALLAQSGSAPWLALTVSGLGVYAVRLSQSMWQFAADLTFTLVQLLLRPVIPVLTADATQHLIRGRRFAVIINQECSGLEGIGLMLVFSVVWLWAYRREFRFPRAYLLVPIGVLTLYSLNAVRIAALLLIGDAGARDIAAGGFHSQAGWIAFNAVAFGMTVAVPRLPWFVLHPKTRVVVPAEPHENPTAAYLLPFLAILATGMLTRAVSANFDWLYAARFFTTAGALWIYRGPLMKLDWRVSWTGFAAGLAAFGLWLALDQSLAIPSAGMPAPLGSATATARALWIAFRALAAITTVPIAEELAFRGFGLRRLASPDFEQVSFRQPGWLAVLISSIAFGLLHGDRWIAGILAGLLFAYAARISNRFGDAVLAHAIANTLLAAWVLTTGQWQYW